MFKIFKLIIPHLVLLALTNYLKYKKDVVVENQYGVIS